MPIRVFIQTEKFKGGPATFRSRLINSLNKFDDIKVVNNVNSKFHIELAFIRKVYNHKRPYILRVDGCYYEENRQGGNREIEKAILGAKYLIFQSNFSFNLCKKILDIGRKTNKEGTDYSIIHNGINLDYVKKIKPNANVEPESFVACAKWRPNKRPISIIKGFLKAGIKNHLYMIGDAGLGGKRIDSKYNSKYVHILGSKSCEETLSIMKSCKYLIHLCHIDSCPNIVIEGLACGLNVLCTNLGGTRELVENDGIVLETDPMWSGKYLPKMNLDSVGRRTVANGIHDLLQIERRPDVSRFDIDKVSKKYVDIIRRNV
jgi:glycosyltransferase involved in cell wall biosynthesis